MLFYRFRVNAQIRSVGPCEYIRAYALAATTSRYEEKQYDKKTGTELSEYANCSDLNTFLSSYNIGALVYFAHFSNSELKLKLRKPTHAVAKNFSPLFQTKSIVRPQGHYFYKTK